MVGDGWRCDASDTRHDDDAGSYDPSKFNAVGRVHRFHRSVTCVAGRTSVSMDVRCRAETEGGGQPLRVPGQIAFRLHAAGGRPLELTFACGMMASDHQSHFTPVWQ